MEWAVRSWEVPAVVNRVYLLDSTGFLPTTLIVQTEGSRHEDSILRDGEAVARSGRDGLSFWDALIWAAAHEATFSIRRLTLLNIWPYQLPTGFAKRPVAVHLQVAELEALTREATRPPEARPVFRWVHFNVPHVPWLRDTGPLAYTAFLNTRDRYFKQLEEVDRTLGAVVASLKERGDLDRTTVVVTSDHGARQGHAGADFPHVPLVVYSPGGTARPLRVRAGIRHPVREQAIDLLANGRPSAEPVRPRRADTPTDATSAGIHRGDS